MSVTAPVIAVTEIQDVYVRQNFLNLQKYFAAVAAIPGSSSVASTETTTATAVPSTRKIKVPFYKALVTDKVLLVDCSDGPISIILPPTGRSTDLGIRVQKIDPSANACTVAPSNPRSESVRDSSSTGLSAQWDVKTFYCLKPVWYY